jgi:hypothetical protein
MQGENTHLRGNISNLENDDLKSGNNLLDRLKCYFRYESGDV